MERARGVAELLDGPLDRRVLAGNLRDLERVNHWLGGSALSWRAVRAIVERGRGASHLTLLDVGTGAADIPRSLLRHGRAATLRLAVTGTDTRPEIIEYARSRSTGIANLEIVPAGDGALDFPANSFDVVHSSLVLHHHEPADVRWLLGEMGRVARRAVIVNDLDRRRRWWLAAWLVSRVATGNGYTRHDAPLSVRRAYRPNEVTAIAAQVGLREAVRLWARPGYRYAVVFVPR